MFAYIDPGSGSVILQMLIAGVIGVIAFFRSYIFKFLRFFKPGKEAYNEVEGSEAKK